MLPVHVQMEKITIAGRPVIHLYADSSPHGSMVYYHGWGSSAESSIFRGGIFASYGFDTYLPDAPYHGQRQSPNLDIGEDIPWRTLMDLVQRNNDEFQDIQDYLKTDKIYLSGHSMGALTVGMILKNYSVQGGLGINGAFDFVALGQHYGLKPQDLEGIDLPMEDLASYQGKVLYMANGGQDQSIPAQIQESFYQALVGSGVSSCHFSLFEDVGHVVTTNMLDEGLTYLLREDK